MSLLPARPAGRSRAPRSKARSGLERLPVSRETRRRWRRRPLPTVPALAARLLEGELGLVSVEWDGWILNHRTGELIAPNGVRWSAGRLMAWEFERQLLDEYRRRLSHPEQWRLV